MELVDGCDLFRLLRRLRATAASSRPRDVRARGARAAPRPRERALGARRSRAADGIIHRDVTPSNIYLSTDGRVKLGDFGIARSANRATLSSGGGRDAQGQVRVPGAGAGRRRAVRPARRSLRDRGGADRDAPRPAAVRRQRAARRAPRHPRLPHRPLARRARLACPRGSSRCSSVRSRATRRIASRGGRVLARPSHRSTRTRRGAKRAAARSSAGCSRRRRPSRCKPSATAAPSCARRRRGASRPRRRKASPGTRTPTRRRARQAPVAPPPARKRGERRAATIGARRGRRRRDRRLDRARASTCRFLFVSTAAGERFGPWPFARLVEAIATGEVAAADRVDFMGREPGAARLDRRARALPPRAHGHDDQPHGGRRRARLRRRRVSTAALVTVLARVIESEATGVLFAEGPTESRRRASRTPRDARAARSSTSSRAGSHHVASNNASELLGEYLVPARDHPRESSTSRSRCSLATGGAWATRSSPWASWRRSTSSARSAIRGATGSIDLFQWRTGPLSFYTDQTAPHVEFPLELELPALILAGIEAAEPGAAPLARLARSRSTTS